MILKMLALLFATPFTTVLLVTYFMVKSFNKEQQDEKDLELAVHQERIAKLKIMLLHGKEKTINCPATPNTPFIEYETAETIHN